MSPAIRVGFDHVEACVAHKRKLKLEATFSYLACASQASLYSLCASDSVNVQHRRVKCVFTRKIPEATVVIVPQKKVAVKITTAVFV